MTPEEHALAEYPREACGLIVVVKGRERYWPCKNLSARPGEHFRLDPEDYAAAEDAGEITTIVHSHPDESAQPSEADRVQCEASGLPWLILSVRRGENAQVAADGTLSYPPPTVAEQYRFAPCGYESPLVGRPFAYGTLDCWQLCRDWYARERGVKLPRVDSVDGWWDDGSSDLYAEAAFIEHGFRTLGRGGDLRLPDWLPGDLIFMQIRSRNCVPNHVGIYLGDGQFLHHLHGRLSSRDVFGGYYLENTVRVMRHG